MSLTIYGKRCGWLGIKSSAVSFHHSPSGRVRGGWCPSCNNKISMKGRIMGYCKLVRQDMTTRGGFKWVVGKWYKIPKEQQGGDLCSQSWFHCYSHPLLAVLFNPIHADFDNPRLYEIRVRGKKKTDGLKFGFTEMKLEKRIALPVLTTNQKVAFALL